MKEKYKKLIEDIDKEAYVEKVVELLTKLNYRFVSIDFLKEHKDFNKLEIEKAHKRYQFMVRMDVIAKDPTKDVYNLKFIVGIRFYDFRSPFIPIYYRGKKIDMLKKPWKVTDTQNMKKKKIPLKFPDGMSIQDRIDWRKTHQRIKDNKHVDAFNLKYYNTWKPHIENIEKENLHLV